LVGFWLERFIRLALFSPLPIEFNPWEGGFFLALGFPFSKFRLCFLLIPDDVGRVGRSPQPRFLVLQEGRAMVGFFPSVPVVFILIPLEAGNRGTAFSLHLWRPLYPTEEPLFFFLNRPQLSFTRLLTHFGLFFYTPPTENPPHLFPNFFRLFYSPPLDLVRNVLFRFCPTAIVVAVSVFPSCGASEAPPLELFIEAELLIESPFFLVSPLVSNFAELGNDYHDTDPPSPFSPLEFSSPMVSLFPTLSPSGYLWSRSLSKRLLFPFPTFPPRCRVLPIP